MFDRALNRFDALNKLNLGPSNITDAALLSLKDMPLQILRLNECGINGSGLAHLRKLRLTDLSLWLCHAITDEAMLHLAEMPLTRLNLGRCDSMTAAGLAHLSEMQLPLTSLDLFHWDQLTDGDLALLQGLPLFKLNLSYCTQLSDAGLLNLHGLPLVQIDLGQHWNEGFTQAGVEALEEACKVRSPMLSHVRVRPEFCGLSKTFRFSPN